MGLPIYKVEVDLGLEYDLGQVLEDAVKVNDDDVVEVDEQPRVTFSRARGEFDARTVISVEAEDEDQAEEYAKEAVSTSYEVEDFVSVRYVNAEILETIVDRLIFEETTSPLTASNDGRLRLETDYSGQVPVHVLKLDGVEVFATYDRAKTDAYVAGWDKATG